VLLTAGELCESPVQLVQKIVADKTTNNIDFFMFLLTTVINYTTDYIKPLPKKQFFSVGHIDCDSPARKTFLPREINAKQSGR